MTPLLSFDASFLRVVVAVNLAGGVMGAVVGPARVDRWAQTTGFRRWAAWYLHHDDRGADRIRAAGGRDEAARWASAHHHRSRWPASDVPITVAEALEAADNA